MERFVYLFYFFFQGIVFFQVLFLLAFYINSKTKESLYFGLFLFFTGINFFISTPELFYNSTGAIVFNSWWFQLFNIPLVSIGNIFFTLFLRDFFGTLIKNKTLTLIIEVVLTIQYFLFIPFIVLYLLGKPTEIIFNIVNFVGLSSCVWMTIIIVRRKMKYANLVAIGFVFYIIGSFLTSYMLILMMNGVHHLFVDQYPLFFVKVGILAVMICYLMAVIKKWNFQEKQLSVQKLESALLEEKMINQINSERSRIAADMHDDVGAGLSRIRYITASMKNRKEIDDSDIDKVVSLSDESVEKMNEIIWALNQGNQQLDELIYYTRSQCSEMVNNAGLVFSFELPENIPNKILDWKDCRNIYLLVKESVNNAIKHADPSTITIECSITDQLRFSIADNGKGFDPTLIKDNGNGLLNYKKRIESLYGTYQIVTTPGEGTKLIFIIPINRLIK
ncbi:MAG: ATP-binding protein [Ferruginibacter sp.]